jgi:hypothetical protein
MLTPALTKLIKTARERADFLEQAIPHSLAEQEAQARALRETGNLNWVNGSSLLRQLATELEDAHR